MFIFFLPEVNVTLVATCLNSMYVSINVTGIAKETRSSCNTTHRISTTFAFQPGTVAVCQQRHSDRGSGGRHLRRHERIPREEPRAARGEQHHEQPRRRPQRPPQAPGPLAGGGATWLLNLKDAGTTRKHSRADRHRPGKFSKTLGGRSSA